MPGRDRDRDGGAGGAGNDGPGTGSAPSPADFNAPVAGNLANLAGERIVFRGRGGGAHQQHRHHQQQQQGDQQQQQQQQSDQPPPPPPPPVSSRTVSVLRRLGEGGFSYVYLVKDVTADSSSGQTDGSGSVEGANANASAANDNCKDGGGAGNDGTGSAPSPADFNAPVAGNLANLAGERIVFRGRHQQHQNRQHQQQQSDRHQQQQGDQQQQQPPPPPPPVSSSRTVSVLRRLGEGGFSYVYLVKDVTETTNDASAAGGGSDSGSTGNTSNASPGGSNPNSGLMVLKITSIQNREQRDMADKEAVLLRKLSHPSIVSVYDSCFRGGGGGRSGKGGGAGSSSDAQSSAPRTIPQHMILMEYCECGHALDVIRGMQSSDPTGRFPIKHLIVSIGQIANAVSYLHAQRPPVVHRDLKLENFLVSRNGAVYKLCDFGSAVLGHVPLVTSNDRNEAGDVVQRTTTQMYRAPEMVDLYMTEWLTESTDVWALGCCLYTMAFFQNCFDQEGSNLAILSANYHKIPPDHRYQDTGLVELIQRMLEVKVDDRADMTEVITCLSAIYSKRPLPPRKKRKKRERRRRGSDSADDGGKSANGSGGGGGRHGRSKSFGGDGSVVGTFRTDGQGVHQSEGIDGVGQGGRQEKKQAKKLNPNSAAARRIKAVRNSTAEASAEASPSSSAAVSPSGSLSVRRKTPDRKSSRRERDRIGGVGAAGAKSRSPSIGRGRTKDGSSRKSRQRGGSFGSSAGSSTGGFEAGAGLFNNDENSFDFRPFDVSPSVEKDSKQDGSMGFSDSNNPFAFSHSDKVDGAVCDVTDPFDFGGISSKGAAKNANDVDDVSTSFPPFEANSLAASSRGDHTEGSPFSSDPRQAQHCATDDDHGFAWNEATFPIPMTNEGSFTAARDEGRSNAGATKNSPAQSSNEWQNERTNPWNRTGKVPPSGHHRKGSSDRYAFQDLETQLGRLRPSTTDAKPRSRTSTAGSSDYHTPGDSGTPGASSSTSSSFESLDDVRDFALGTFEVPISRFEEMTLASRSNVNQEDNPSEVQDKVGVLEPVTTFEEV